MATLNDVILALTQRIQTLEQRVAASRRPGVVTDVDTQNRLMRARVGGTDEDPHLTPWLPWTELAGGASGINVAWSPRPGQNVMIDAPGGDLRQAVASPMTWSDAHGAPTATGDGVIKFGSTTVTVKGDSLTLQVGGASIRVADGEVLMTVGGTTARLTGAGFDHGGGYVKHDGKSIDKGHIHGGVEPGGATTSVPAN